MKETAGDVAKRRVRRYGDFGAGGLLLREERKSGLGARFPFLTQSGLAPHAALALEHLRLQ